MAEVFRESFAGGIPERIVFSDINSFVAVSIGRWQTTAGADRRQRRTNFGAPSAPWLGKRG